jgi:hypothetical protein
MSKVIIGLFLFSLICFTQAKINPPYFSQHDSRWGRQALGFGPQTISEEGCFLTITTSMVSYLGIPINGALPNPSTMNAWLKAHKSFRGDILFYTGVEALGFSYEGMVTSTTEIKNAMNEGKFAMLHVLNGRHWVLATGFISGGYTVMDPGNVTHTQKYSDVVGCAIYSFPSSSGRRLYEEHDDSQSEQSESEYEPVTTDSQNLTDATSPSSEPAPASSSPIATSPSDSQSESQQSRGSPTVSNLRGQSAN